jgi:hypothetical protein
MGFKSNPDEAPMSFWKNTGRFLFGEKGGRENIYSPEQQQLQSNMYQQAQTGITGNPTYQGANKYLQNLFSNDPSAYAAFEAPYKQQFEQQTIPGIAERFAGQGACNQSSSAFRNEMAQAGGNYTTGLAALRANMQMQALPQALSYAQAPMQNLAQLGQFGFKSPYQEREGSPGFLGSALGIAGGALAGGVGAGVGKGLGGIISNWFGETPKKSSSSLGRQYSFENMGQEF